MRIDNLFKIYLKYNYNLFKITININVILPDKNEVLKFKFNKAYSIIIKMIK